MTATTQTLSDFLLARIAEDEAAALSAPHEGPWIALTIYPNRSPIAQDLRGIRAEDDETDWTLIPDAGAAAAHVARHDPARVLAQCAAFRAIVEEHGANQCRVDPCDAHDASFRTVPCPTLRALASIWRDHDEFQEAWL